MSHFPKNIGGIFMHVIHLMHRNSINFSLNASIHDTVLICNGWNLMCNMKMKL